MTQWLMVRALVALTEDLDSVPSAHMLSRNHLEFQFQEIQWLLLSS